MPEAKTIMLYQYSELSDSAKEKARDWWRGCMDSSDYESTIDDFVTCAAILGVDVSTRLERTCGGGQRPFPEVRWSLSYSQGDGAAFRGSYAYKKGAAQAIRKHAPNDAELARIADELQAIQKRNFYRVHATMTDGSLSNFYTHSGTMAVDVDADDGRGERIPSSEDDAAVTQLMRDLADWLYARLRDEDEYLTSEEQIADAMGMNEYTFREDGTRED